jgi:Resolvase, N terminal domain
MRISAFNRSCERKQSHIYPSKSLKKVAISFDHDPILFSTANPVDEVFGRHRSVLSTLYDDGGYSGGTLDRPALQRLLADIAAAKVDVVVVYKIDRLTRSLFDFAKIVEAIQTGLSMAVTSSGHPYE